MRHRLGVFLLMLSGICRGAELSIDSGTVRSGEPVTLNVRLSAADEALTGLQFDLEYDASALDVRVEIGPSAKTAVKILQTARTAKSGHRAMIVGFNQNNLSDGVVAVLYVSVKEAPLTVTDYPIRLTAAAGTNARAESIAVTGREGILRVPVRNSTK